MSAAILSALAAAVSRPRTVVPATVRSPLRVLATAAQDETAVHPAFWHNLHAYARHLGARVAVGGFTYNKSLFEDHDVRSGIFPVEVRPYLSHVPLEIGPVVFAAEMNILPTAVRPLNGLQTYTRSRPGVFPHAKIQLESLPTRPGAEVPIVVTTGACTVPNYVAKKAGLKAVPHHALGATLIEVDAAGDWFLRQIEAEPDGSFQDLDAVVRDGLVSRGSRVEAITWGDVHREQLDRDTALTAWGYDVDLEALTTRDTMLDALRPRVQFFHDLLDFQARNHHRRGDVHHMFKMIAHGSDDVAGAIRSCALFLRGTFRTWCESVVVESNHDRALMRWLKEADWRQDPRNARCYLRWNDRILQAIEDGDGRFNVFRHALAEADPDVMAMVKFVAQDDSYDVAGIEMGMHGDDGPNGARGSMATLTKLSRRANIGHSHVAGIMDGIYQAGVNGSLDMGYNHGPSSWTASDIVTYPNGKRTIVTKRGRKWRA